MNPRGLTNGKVGHGCRYSIHVGAALGATVFKSYNDATLAAMCLAICSGILLAQLPTPKAKATTSKADIDDGENKTKSKGDIWNYFMLPASRTWVMTCILFKLLR